MRTRRFACTAALAAFVLTGSAAAAVLPKVNGTVGPGATITVKLAGKKVKTLRPGKRTFTIDDRSAAHNFRLVGPGVNRATGVLGTGRKTWAVTLRRGTYRFLCDPHALEMKGSFTVK